MTHITCRLTAKNRDQLWNPTLGNRVWATFTFFAVTECDTWFNVTVRQLCLSLASGERQAGQCVYQMQTMPRYVTTHE